MSICFTFYCEFLSFIRKTLLKRGFLVTRCNVLVSLFRICFIKSFFPLNINVYVIFISHFVHSVGEKLSFKGAVPCFFRDSLVCIVLCFPHKSRWMQSQWKAFCNVARGQQSLADTQHTLTYLFFCLYQSTTNWSKTRDTHCSLLPHYFITQNTTQSLSGYIHLSGFDSHFSLIALSHRFPLLLICKINLKMLKKIMIKL